jgi:hypothetical protein
MKKIFLLIVCAISFAAAQAQLKYGIKAGLNFANLVGPDVDDNGLKLGVHFGGFANFQVADKFTVQPELIFSAQGARFEDPGDDDKYRFSYLNIPLLGQYNDPSGFYGETGPQFGFLLSAKAKHDGHVSSVKDGYRTVDFSWAFGAGYKVTPEASIGVRFNLGLSNISDNSHFKVRNSVLQIGVAYVLGTAK